MQKPGEALQRWREASPEERAELTEQRRERMKLAWDMKVCQGKSYREIGEALDMSATACLHYVQTVAQEMLEADLGHIPLVRAREVGRVDHMMDSLMPAVNQRDYDAIKLVNSLMIQKARLLGLYAPVKVKMEHTSSRVGKDLSREEVDKKLAELYQRLKRRGKSTEEFDRWASENKEIVDAEVVKVEDIKT